jgi:hypothetical protein
MGFLEGLARILSHHWGADEAWGTSPKPLPVRESKYELVYIDPPLPPGVYETSFGRFNPKTGEFIDSHGKGGTYELTTQRLMDSEGVVMMLSDFMAMPKKQRRFKMVKVGEDLV